MAFSYSPLDLYYSFSAIVRNDQMNEERMKGLNDFMIIKRETEKMFKFLRNTFNYSWTGIIQFFFGFNGTFTSTKKLKRNLIIMFTAFILELSVLSKIK